MQGTSGSSYLIASVRSAGHIQLTTTGISPGNLFWDNSLPGITFIDQNEPNLQVIWAGNSFYLYNPSGSTILTSLNSYYLPGAASDYDSQSNTLYAGDFINGAAFLRKITGIGTSPQSTTLSLPGVTDLPYFIKLSPNRTSLFVVVNYPIKLLKITNLGQTTPTITTIDNGAFPQNAAISCIDVGTDNNELLVTLSNYGVQSVWYTTNGGATWTGKDQSNFGLPDVPVRSALFNPINRKQVLLGTDAGIWSTTDVTAANPGWTYSGAGMGPFRVNQLRYRASDGRVTAATSGRGVWQSDALAVSVTATTGADVSLDMSVNNRTPRVDELVEFTLRLNNAGPLEANSVRVSSRLPPNMTFVDSPSAGVVFAGDSVRIDVGTISADGTATLQFRAKATQPGVFITAAQVVFSDVSDPDSQPASGTEDGQDDAATTDIRTPDAGVARYVSPNPYQTPLPPVQDSQPPIEPTKADLSLSMATSTLTPNANQPFSLSLTVSNRGGVSASTISVATLLPTGWQLSSMANLTVNGQIVTGTLPGVPVGGSATLVLFVQATNSGTVKAQVMTATPADPDSTPGNGYDNGEDDEASVSVRVQ